MREIKCACGNLIRIVDSQQNVACPKCGVYYGDVSKLTDAQIGHLIKKQLGQATRSSLLPLPLVFLVWLAVVVFVFAKRGIAAQLLGWNPAPSYAMLILWLAVLVVLVFVLAGMCSGVSSGFYTLFTGKTYVQDRVSYAKAGGLDISYWSPALAFLLLAGLYWITLRPTDSISFLRGPWLLFVVWSISSLIVAALLGMILFPITRKRIQ